METEHLSHPAVEIQLPLDGNSDQYVIPSETTLFFWRALAPGTEDRLAPPDTSRGSEQIVLEGKLWEKASWSISLDGETVPLLTDSVFRDAGYRGVAWWAATDVVELPAVLTVQFETRGEPPVIDGEPIVCWADNGRKIPWNTRIESEINLQPPSNSTTEFETHQENLWDRHLIYKPLLQVEDLCESTG
jgi:hypothetical protein